MRSARGTRHTAARGAARVLPMPCGPREAEAGREPTTGRKEGQAKMATKIVATAMAGQTGAAIGSLRRAGGVGPCSNTHPGTRQQRLVGHSIPFLFVAIARRCGAALHLGTAHEGRDQGCRCFGEGAGHCHASLLRPMPAPPAPVPPQALHCDRVGGSVPARAVRRAQAIEGRIAPPERVASRTPAAHGAAAGGRWRGPREMGSGRGEW